MPGLTGLPPGWELPRGAWLRLRLARAEARARRSRTVMYALSAVLLAMTGGLLAMMVCVSAGSHGQACRIIYEKYDGQVRPACARP